MCCSVSATPLAPFPSFRSPLLFLFSYQEKETRKQINKDDFPQAHVELIWCTGVTEGKPWLLFQTVSLPVF